MLDSFIGTVDKNRMALGGAHVPPTKVFRRLTASVNETILKPRLAAATNTYTSDFPDVKFRITWLIYFLSAALWWIKILYYTIAEKGIRFRHPDYNPDRAQKLISSYMSRHLSTRNILSKSMHAFLSNLANRQTDRQTDKRGQTRKPPPLSVVINDSLCFLSNERTWSVSIMIDTYIHR